jgi:predicted outer membrane repeat protein
MKKMKSKLAVISLLIVACLALMATIVTRSVVAATFTVSNLNDSGPGSLRQAILDANSAAGADTIEFQGGLSGTITLTSGQLTIDDPTGGSLTINGPGAQVLAVNGNNASGVLSITSADTVTISGLTITGGNNAFGGGINNAGTLTLTNSTVSGNTASGLGGGIMNLGTLIITSSTITGNTATAGGGIRNDGTLTITSSTISGNTAFVGGGIYNFGPLTITSSTVSGNTAGGFGGGISNFDSLTITNSTITGNTAMLTFGGGIFDSGILKITHSTITGNTAGSLGGGIYAGTAVSLKGSIVANNTATSGNAPDISGQVSGTFNLIENTTGATISGSNNITGVDPLLGPLADNGGPTQTHALLTGSPAIDALADCTDIAGNPITTDQRGIARPQGAACDIGAFEVEASIVYDVCLQDDANPGVVFLGNSITGEYVFCCGGTTFTGVAAVIKKGRIVNFQHHTTAQRVMARYNGGVFKGSASLQSSPGTTRCTITDRDTRNNTCTCGVAQQ